VAIFYRVYLPIDYHSLRLDLRELQVEVTKDRERDRKTWNECVKVKMKSLVRSRRMLIVELTGGVCEPCLRTIPANCALKLAVDIPAGRGCRHHGSDPSDVHEIHG